MKRGPRSPRKKRPGTPVSKPKALKIIQGPNTGLIPGFLLHKPPQKLLGNPILLWEKYRAARRHGRPVPSEFLEYLDAAARDICARSEGGDQDDVILKALGFRRPRGQGASMFADARDVLERSVLALRTEAEVRALAANHGDVERGLDRAYRNVAAATGKSVTYIRKLHKDFAYLYSTGEILSFAKAPPKA
jgi:hypothetical protein